MIIHINEIALLVGFVGLTITLWWAFREDKYTKALIKWAISGKAEDLEVKEGEKE